MRYELPDQMKGHRSKLKSGTREEAGNEGKSKLSHKQKIYTEVYSKLKNSLPKYLLFWQCWNQSSGELFG